ncbi:MAG TPA: hypothetical protein VGB03_01845, partial [Acidimicrobiales bacterium]
LPSVPAVAPCSSTLRPVSIAGGAPTGPTAESRTAPGSLPATGATTAAAAGAALAVAALMAWRLRLRSAR